MRTAVPAHLLAITITILCCGLLACGGSSNAGEAATTVRQATSSVVVTTVRPTTTSVPDTPDQAAVRKVAEAWSKAAFRLAGKPDPDDPALERYLTGEMLSGWKVEWKRRKEEGLLARMPVPSKSFYRVDEIVVKGSLAQLAECAVDDGILYQAGDGTVENDDVTTLELETIATKERGVWKLAARKSHKLEGVAGCALER